MTFSLAHVFVVFLLSGWAWTVLGEHNRTNASLITTQTTKYIAVTVSESFAEEVFVSVPCFQTAASDTCKCFISFCSVTLFTLLYLYSPVEYISCDQLLSLCFVH